MRTRRGEERIERSSEHTTAPHTAPHLVLSAISACAYAISSSIRHIRSYLKNDVLAQSSFSIFLCTITGITAGAVFSSFSEILNSVPGLLILIPPANDMRGNVYGAMASRLGTAMHLGIFSPSLRDSVVLRNNMQSAITLTLSFSVVLGVLAKFFAGVSGMQISVWWLIFISVFGGIISGAFLLGITIAISIFAYRRRLDIDNFSSPLITSAGDMITIPSLYLGAFILLHLGDLRDAFAITISAIAIVLALILTLSALCTTHLRRTICESYPVLLICGVIGLLTGTLLESRLENLIRSPEALAMIPPFLGVSGALGGILSARISSMLHIGMIEPRLLPERRNMADFTSIYMLSSFFILVGTLSWLSSTIAGIGSSSLGKTMLLSVIAGILCTSFINIITYYIAVLSFKAGLDPDNDTIPLITSLTDIFGVICILAALSIVR